MVSESQREGLLDAAQTQRLNRTLSSAEKTVADVLVPLERVTALPPNPTVGAVEEAVARTGFSRFPVQAPEAPDAHPRLDTDPLAPGTAPLLPEDGAGAEDAATTREAGDRAPLVDFTGYLHVKDVLDLTTGGTDADADAVMVPEERVRDLPRLATSAPVDEALAALRREGSHLARAVDSDGSTVGVVALEDLVEEYVGTVRDSTHVGRPSATATRQRPA